RPVLLRNKLEVGFLDLIRRRRFAALAREQPRIHGNQLVNGKTDRRLVDRRHRAFFIVRSLHPKACDDIAVRTRMGFGNILYGSLRGSTARARLFLYGIPFVGVGLAVLGIFEPFEGARWNPEKIRRSLTQKTLLETMAQRALALSDRALRAARPNRPENELLAKLGTVGGRHLFDIFAPFSFEWRGIGFHLREPIAEARQAGGDK